MVWIISTYLVRMTYKPRKGDFGELKSEKYSPGEHAPRSDPPVTWRNFRHSFRKSVSIYSTQICRSRISTCVFWSSQTTNPLQPYSAHTWCLSTGMKWCCFHAYPIHNCVAHTCYILSCWAPFWKVTEAGSLYIGIQMSGLPQDRNECTRNTCTTPKFWCGFLKERCFHIIVKYCVVTGCLPGHQVWKNNLIQSVESVLVKRKRLDMTKSI